MRIAQIVLPGAGAYERKSQRIDAAALAAAHEVTLVSIDDVARAGAQVAHVYGPRELPSSAFLKFPLPYVASGSVATSRLPWRRPVAPRAIVAPFDQQKPEGRNGAATDASSGGPRRLHLPEAVEDFWYDLPPRIAREDAKTIGTYRAGRAGVASMIERSTARIHRFRSDIVWKVFDHVPSAADLTGVDAWVDPASEESDLDGFVAEAVVCGLPVVATRTPVNYARLEKGRIGFAPPANDPNELVHAILAALFKPEVAQQKIEAARQTRSKFRPRQRLRHLLQLYETLIR